MEHPWKGKSNCFIHKKNYIFARDWKAMAELKILLNIYLEFVSEILLHIP